MGNSVAHSFHVAKGKFIKKMMIRLEECHDPSGSFADDQQIENNRLLCFLICIKAITIKPFDIRHRQFGGIHHLIESESQPILHQTNTASNSAF